MQAIADGDGKRLKDRRASGRIAGGTSFGNQGPLPQGPFSVARWAQIPGAKIAHQSGREAPTGIEPV